MSDPERRALEEAAGLYGVGIRHADGLGREVEVGSEALAALLRALGAPVERPADAREAVRLRREERAVRIVEPVVVRWSGADLEVPLFRSPGGPLAWTLRLEDGEVVRGEAAAEPPSPLRPALGRELPPGYHRLDLESRAWSASVRVISAPVRAHPGPAGRRWAAFLPLHALHGRESWEIGDLGDLGRLARWTSALGGSALGCLPLLPAFLDHPFDPSPYAPLSRRFWNEVYLDPRRLPGFERSEEARRVAASGCFQAAGREGSEGRTGEGGRWVRHRRAMALKRKVSAVLSRECLEAAGAEASAVRRFEAERPLAGDYAEFRAVNDRLGTAWQGWPERLRSGRLETGDYDPEERWLHLWMQWAVDAQLRETAREAEAAGAPLYLDFPVGVHAGGFDVWKERTLFALGASAGAPPDSLFTGGQDWGLPPLHPERLRESGYAHWIDCLRHHLAPAGLLRLDHVMQLQRLYWVPAGFPATDGAYVRQPAEELLAILCLESVRHRTAIVGENLGTVPAETGEAIARHGLLGLYVLQFELHPDRPPAPPPAASVAGLNTHDMPTFRGFCEGRDLDELAALGLLPEAGRLAGKEERAALLGALRREALAEDPGAAPGGEEVPVSTLLRRQLDWLADSPAAWVLVNLEDLWGEGEPQNVPGTSFERPNWRRKAALGLEEIETDAGVAALLGEVDRRRRAADRSAEGS